jgi:hypothetical protein
LRKIAVPVRSALAIKERGIISAKIMSFSASAMVDRSISLGIFTFSLSTSRVTTNSVLSSLLINENISAFADPVVRSNMPRKLIFFMSILT